MRRSRPCQPTHANSFMTARGVVYGSSLNRATAASFVPMGPFRARRFKQGVHAVHRPDSRTDSPPVLSGEEVLAVGTRLQKELT